MTTTASSVSNVTPFPMLECNNLETNNNNNNYNYNNNTRARVCAAVATAEEAAEHTIMHGDFGQTYMDAIGRPMPNVVRREIDEMTRRGIDSTLIHAVLEYTAGAPRPSWAYARAVILRNYARGINNDADFLESVGLGG